MKHKANNNQDKFMRIVTALTYEGHWNPDLSEIAKSCDVSYNYARATVKKLRVDGKIKHEINIKLK
jgi:DNA-binding Lrp family transcriptional regulator